MGGAEDADSQGEGGDGLVNGVFCFAAAWLHALVTMKRYSTPPGGPGGRGKRGEGH